jgi:preprotein translocase subunit SecY
VAQSIDAFKNAFKIPELKSRILFTLGLLAVYRLGTFVPTPGVRGQVLAEVMGGGGFLQFYNLFSGGAFEQATLFALGIMPYITASIIMSLLVPVVPRLQEWQREGGEGQKKITRWTRYGTIIICLVQALGYAFAIKQMDLNNPEVSIISVGGTGVFYDMLFYFMCVVSFTTGTAFIMWLGEQISERGIGNGISLIIFVSIVSRMPLAVIRIFDLIGARQLNIFQALLLVALLVLVVGGAILLTLGQRRIPVQYPRQVKGRRVYGGQRNYLPLRVNQAGVIPIIFASSLLMLPGMAASAINVPFIQNFLSDFTRTSSVWYNLAYAGLIVFFSFFYTSLIFNPVEIADNMKKYGGIVTGVRPGKATAEYLQKVMFRVTTIGAVLLAVIALLPTLVYSLLNVYDWNIVSFFGGTSLLILVGVALDTIRQMEQHLIMHHYDGFMKGRRIRGRKG